MSLSPGVEGAVWHLGLACVSTSGEWAFRESEESSALRDENENCVPVTVAVSEMLHWHPGVGALPFKKMDI